MKNEPITHDKPFPVTASAGPDNAYYLRHCHAIERGPAYTACLSRLHDIDKGISNERTAECAKTAREGRCTAAGMREQEQLAGQALFYFPRGSKPFLPVKVAGDFGVLITNLTDPALVPKPVPTFGLKKPMPAPIKLDAELAVDPMAVAISSAAAKLSAEAPTGVVTPEKLAPVIAQMNRPATSPEPITQAQLLEELRKNPVKVELPPMVAPGTGSTENKLQPGETPLQFARRMAALRNAPKT